MAGKMEDTDGRRASIGRYGGAGARSSVSHALPGRERRDDPRVQDRRVAGADRCPAQVLAAAMNRGQGGGRMVVSGTVAAGEVMSCFVSPVAMPMGNLIG